ncbi:Lrp/AsnC family transcriptional regulator [Haloarcula nitratireducens]|uniref:Lrp/AsnC family transcriptional regulator n=1 Tax=Haloarcula nitratireducens TaxID=2487749 RepID=A0AAW4PBD1_9EURY|nr:Lrp/AsnC family transcriptional regulator [Halomicroarcula nitratireducens]MBX0295446.1 Lrp/AsnC family transcriptional regulator [Halomicroarcula nitratireducens]
MSELDATDVTILELLMEDARRSYREIAEDVGLSPPTVSNRVDRLRDLGIVQGFTVEVDRTAFSGEDECLVVVETSFEETEAVFSRLRDADDVEHVFRTAESTVVAKVVSSPSAVHGLLGDALNDDQVTDYHIESVLASAWQPQLGADELDVECSICGKRITGDGETVEVDSDDTYHVCCSACAEKIAEQYESLEEGLGE